MKEIYANISIEFDGKELFIAEDNSSGCEYSIKDKKDLLEHVLGYVLDCLDYGNKFDFELKER